MICPVPNCGIRWAPRRKDKWVITDDPFTIKPLDKDAEEEYMKCYDSDEKVPCGRCSV